MAPGRCRHLLCLGCMLLLCPLPRSGAEQALTAGLPPGGRFRTVERADMRKFENGKLLGLVSRETLSVLSWEAVPEGQKVEGTLYVLEEMSHAGGAAAREVQQSLPVSYLITPYGSWEVASEAGVPALRGFPVFPAGEMAPGDRWKAPGERIIDPLGDGRSTRVKFVCDYLYEGEKVSDGRTARLVSARYALRYRRGEDPAGDERIESVGGTHAVKIWLGFGGAVFIQDRVEEEYRLSGGKTVSYKGFSLLWVASTAPLDREETLRAITAAIRDSGGTDVEVEKKPQGVTLSVNRIHFVADQAEVLPEDLPRLRAVAQALRLVSGRSFRVIGHTARVGTEESQQELSVRRAKAVVDFLVSSGIGAERFLYEGRGGTQPVAPNDTEENRAGNRRVEIVILED